MKLPPLRIIQIGAAVLAMGFVVWMVPFRDLGQVIEHANVTVLIGAWLVYLASYVIWTLRFRILLAIAGVPLPFGELLRVNLEAQAGGIILPGGVGGDALRIAAIAQRGTPVPVGLAAALLDRALGLTTVATLACIAAIAISPGGIGPTTLFTAALPIGFVMFVSLMQVNAVRKRLARIGANHERGIFRAINLMIAYFSHPRAPRAIALASIPSFLNSAIQLVVLRAVLYAIGAHPESEHLVYVGCTMGMVAGAIPALPGGWGTADAAYVFFLQRAGVLPAAALTMSLMYRLFWYSAGFGGAAIIAVRSRLRSV